MCWNGLTRILVVNLLLEEKQPKVFADELDNVQRIDKSRSMSRVAILYESVFLDTLHFDKSGRDRSERV